MNKKNKLKVPLGQDAPVSELLLADTAIRVELPPSQHKLAVERSEAVQKHIERPDSPLHDLVQIFYPQGSMAIRATIRARQRDDGYDIDIVAEINWPYGIEPHEALDLLFKAIKGEKGSLYYDMAKRQTRCVTVEYADGMHLDVTPSQLIDEYDPRLSTIFHAKQEEPKAKHKRVVVNSYAFVDWFNARTPIDLDFELAYAKRARAADELLEFAKADSEPVPEHSSKEGGKSVTVVALQLLKRNRNIRYQSRFGRIPPSVMMSKFAGDVAAPNCSISQALDNISAHMLDELKRADTFGVLVDVRNPRCADDKFTDRWPENAAAQRQYIEDLELFRRQLEALRSDELSLSQMKDLLSAMFGEEPATLVIEEYAKRFGAAVQQNTRSVGKGGRITAGAIGAPSVITSLNETQKGHTFYGGRIKK